MKKTILLFALVLASSFIDAQNPWIKCDALEVLTNKLPKTISNTGYGNAFGTDTALGFYNGGAFTDTCILLKMNSKCPSLDSSEGVLMCFDSTGKVSYSVLKTLRTMGSNNWWGLRENFFGLANGAINGGTNPPSVVHKVVGDTIYLMPDNTFLNEFNTYEEFESFHGGYNSGAPFKFRCDTCVERIIGIGIGAKKGTNDGDGNPIEQCLVSCDSLHAGPTSPPPPGGSLPQGPLSAHAQGNGILTYKWSFGGVPLAGGGVNCPNIDMTAIPGGGMICVTVTNWLPDGRNCSCVMCIGLCYNIIQPTKMASNFMSPITDLYPSPAKDKLRLILNSPSNDVVYIRVINKEGKELKKLFYPTNKGYNQYELDIQSLSGGIYWLNAQSREFQEVKPFFKE